MALLEAYTTVKAECKGQHAKGIIPRDARKRLQRASKSHPSALPCSSAVSLEAGVQVTGTQSCA